MFSLPIVRSVQLSPSNHPIAGLLQYQASNNRSITPGVGETTLASRYILPSLLPFFLPLLLPKNFVNFLPQPPTIPTRTSSVLNTPHFDTNTQRSLDLGYFYLSLLSAFFCELPSVSTLVHRVRVIRFHSIHLHRILQSQI